MDCQNCRGFTASVRDYCPFCGAPLPSRPWPSPPVFIPERMPRLMGPPPYRSQPAAPVLVPERIPPLMGPPPSRVAPDPPLPELEMVRLLAPPREPVVAERHLAAPPALRAHPPDLMTMDLPR
ncbi:MAG: hypothetical protein FWH40_03125 [Coriobacteriia bacterium]|nr:hypothetical protein [Coriobacteriia bacterium]